MTGPSGYPYHLDGQLCAIYPAADIRVMAAAATAHKLYQTTYYNHLAAWVRRAETVEELEAITYGAALPQDLGDNMAEILGLPTMRHNLCGHALRWAVGGVLYGGLELIWRGYTHPTMILLATALCVPLDLANERMPWELPLWLQAVLGGLTITAAELAAGLVLNAWLGLGIWDYSGLWGNFWGQICPQFSALWCLLAGPVIIAFDWLDYWLCAGDRPNYRLI